MFKKQVLFGHNSEITDELIHPYLVFDDNPDRDCFGTWEDGLQIINEEECDVYCGVCSTATARGRAIEKIEEALSGGLYLSDWGPPLISRHAVVMGGACIDAGALVLAGAFVGPHAHIRMGAALLPCSRVHHCADIGCSSIIVSGAQVLGRAEVGSRVWVCANAVVCPDVAVGDDSVVWAGAVARTAVPNSGQVMRR